MIPPFFFINFFPFFFAEPETNGDKVEGEEEDEEEEEDSDDDDDNVNIVIGDIRSTPSYTSLGHGAPQIGIKRGTIPQPTLEKGLKVSVILFLYIQSVPNHPATIFF